jgi:predicted HTH transcriptional regulator
MYATYSKVENFADVPSAGPLDFKVRESNRLDFKETASPHNPAEHAKDMATFANAFGGVVLIGTKSADGVLTHPGISRSHAARMAEVYEQAAKDLCSPPPIVCPNIVQIPDNDHVLLAVNPPYSRPG